MDGGNEQRIARKCCFKVGLSATETLVLVQKAYENEAWNRSNVFRGYSRFGEGRKLVDDERGGCPKSTLRYTLLLLLIWSKMTFESYQE
jgi:hypothetical protein